MIKNNIPLAPLTTFGLGGTAERFISVSEPDQLRDVRRDDEWRLLGSGSNLLINDCSLPGLTIANRIGGLTLSERGNDVFITAGSGMDWDALARFACEKGWQGIECLSGIPGTVGAAPVQNIGAYGQSIADTLHEVRGLELDSGENVIFDAAACRFGYRTSIFQTGKLFTTSVTLKLRAGGEPTLTYQDLSGLFEGKRPSLVDVRNAVLNIRASKGALAMDGYPRLRSAGSFFKNPFVSPARVASLALELGPRDARTWFWPQADGTVKLSAGKLIEGAGFPRGFREGPVGNSPYHSLSLVAYDGATSADVVGLARRIQETVVDRFQIVLDAEPQLWGWETYPLLNANAVPDTGY